MLEASQPGLSFQCTVDILRTVLCRQPSEGPDITAYECKSARTLYCAHADEVAYPGFPFSTRNMGCLHESSTLIATNQFPRPLQRMLAK